MCFNMAHPLFCECSTANMTALLRKDVIAYYYGLEDKYVTLDSFQWGSILFYLSRVRIILPLRGPLFSH